MRRLPLLSCSVALVAAGTSGCFDWDNYDPRLVEGPVGGASGSGGAGLQGGSAGSAGSAGDGGGSTLACEGTAFECLPDGTARQCDGSTWQSLGACPLGCDEESAVCQVPSNVDPGAVGQGDGTVAVASPDGVVFDTDTGEIRTGTGVLRPAGEGVDDDSGIAFSVQAQGDDEPSLGVFSLGALDVDDGAELRGEGANALVLVVDGEVTIDGLVTVAAVDDQPGPGGFAGGAPGADGGGDCGGKAGTGHYTGAYCASGGGGAGYSALGGPGGACTCATPDDFAGGEGGPATCGTDALVPLVGGSGGAGGTPSQDGPDDNPGPGGGGGGALQITASGTIEVGATGRIDAGGGGGGQCTNAGGAGGGSGGALLLEAPVVTIAVGAVLAANGGGGGGGDCN